MDFEEDFLRDVLGFGNEFLAEDGDGETKHERAMARDQLREGLLVAALGAGYELGVGVCH